MKETEGRGDGEVENDSIYTSCMSGVVIYSETASISTNVGLLSR